jgi:hypothetical protein
MTRTTPPALGVGRPHPGRSRLGVRSSRRRRSQSSAASIEIGLNCNSNIASNRRAPSYKDCRSLPNLLRLMCLNRSPAFVANNFSKSLRSASLRRSRPTRVTLDVVTVNRSGLAHSKAGTYNPRTIEDEYRIDWVSCGEPSGLKTLQSLRPSYQR